MTDTRTDTDTEAQAAAAGADTANATVTWTAHLKNEKAAWYQFQMAMDIPEVDHANPAMSREQATSCASWEVGRLGKAGVSGKRGANRRQGIPGNVFGSRRPNLMAVTRSRADVRVAGMLAPQSKST